MRADVGGFYTRKPVYSITGYSSTDIRKLRRLRIKSFCIMVVTVLSYDSEMI